MQGLIQYCRGDVLVPLNRGHRHVVIPHVCNDAGGWGAGFTGNLSRAWPEPEAAYRQVAERGLMLGITQFVETPGRRWLQHEQRVTVANMVAQRGFRGLPSVGRTSRPPLRYGALAACMNQVAMFAAEHAAAIHAPWFGTDLAGGHPATIDQLVWELWVERGLEVLMYEFDRDARRHGILRSERPT